MNSLFSDWLDSVTFNLLSISLLFFSDFFLSFFFYSVLFPPQYFVTCSCVTDKWWVTIFPRINWLEKKEKEDYSKRKKKREKEKKKEKERGNVFSPQTGNCCWLYLVKGHRATDRLIWSCTENNWSMNCWYFQILAMIHQSYMSVSLTLYQRPLYESDQKIIVSKSINDRWKKGKSIDSNS